MASPGKGQDVGAEAPTSEGKMPTPELEAESSSDQNRSPSGAKSSSSARKAAKELKEPAEAAGRASRPTSTGKPEPLEIDYYALLSDLSQEAKVVLSQARPNGSAKKEAREEAATYDAFAHQEMAIHVAYATINRKRAKRDMELRKEYASKAYELACWGVWFWIAMFAIYGIVRGCMGRVIFSDAVMISITAGATVNVAAAFLGVIRGLFPASHAEPLIPPPAKAIATLRASNRSSSRKSSPKSA